MLSLLGWGLKENFWILMGVNYVRLCLTCQHAHFSQKNKPYRSFVFGSIRSDELSRYSDTKFPLKKQWYELSKKTEAFHCHALFSNKEDGHSPEQS